MSTKGLVKKFTVTRTDGTDQFPGSKHFDCHYFVLDVKHDPFAADAILAYVKACKETKPELAHDLLVLVAGYVFIEGVQ